MLRAIAILGLVLAVAGCASEPRRDFARHGGPRGEPGMGPPGEDPRRGPRLFISPSGEPFRGDDGLAAWFARADSDHDGAITLAEFQADAERFFRVLDANGDGVIDGFEIQAYEQNIAPEITTTEVDRLPGAGRSGQDRGGGMAGGGRRGRGGMGRGGGRSMDRGQPQGASEDAIPRGAGREGAARYSLINEAEPVANADENIDSRVSLDEWRRATLRRFAVLDKAKTGRLTLDQLRGRSPSTSKR